MLKETGYQEKIEMLAIWLEEIIETVKRDLKNEHLKVDRTFCRKYFLGKNPSHVSIQEMSGAYRQDIREGNVGLGEFIATRWLLKNTDIYSLFEAEIRNYASDFEALDELPQDLSERLLQKSIQQYGAKKTYLFSVFNSVVFPKEIYEQLRKGAEEESEGEESQWVSEKEEFSLESLRKRHEREMTTQAERYEKKLAGLQKKYLQDTETLKKQISSLHKKLNEGMGAH